MIQLDFKNDYICTYKNVLSEDQCQHLIDKFEDSQHQQSKTNLKGHMSFTEINLNKTFFGFSILINNYFFTDQSRKLILNVL